MDVSCRAAFTRVIACMAPALLTALVLTAAFSDGQQLGAGAETVGVAFGGLLLWRGRSLVLAVVVAVAVTAGLRACCDVTTLTRDRHGRH